MNKLFKKASCFLGASLILSSSMVTFADNNISKNQELQIKEYKEKILAEESFRPNKRAGDYSLGDTQEQLHNKSIMRSTFYADISDTGLSTRMDGQSKAAWLGATPTDADQIDLTTTVKITGIGITASQGNSNFTISGGLTSKTLAMTDTIKDDWRLIQDYYNINFDGIDLKYTHTASSKFTFGQNRYYIDASDYVRP